MNQINNEEVAMRFPVPKKLQRIIESFAKDVSKRVYDLIFERSSYSQTEATALI